jgi:uncharacterized membrane protein YfcA
VWTTPTGYDYRVSPEKLSILIGAFFLTSVVSAVTGSTSLITVPVMIALGIEPHVAIATNMLALTFMSAGASLPFAHKGVIDRSHLPISILLTVVGSVVGALLVLRVPIQALRIIIAISMIGVAAFSLKRRAAGTVESDHHRTPVAAFTGYVLTLLLGIYGGFFSGGYVTMLTAAFVVFFGMTFLQAVATTKVVNVSSSGVATLIFLCRGVLDLKLGLILGAVMFIGGLLGSRLVLRIGETWLRPVFLLAVLILAAKMVWSLI